MYNLIEYCKNYRKTITSLWNYYRDEFNNSLFIFVSNPPVFDYNGDFILYYFS